MQAAGKPSRLSAAGRESFRCAAANIGREGLLQMRWYKTGLALLLCCCLLAATASPVSAWTEYPTGDIDNGGKIDAADALLALQHSVKLTTLEGTKATAADVTRDGTIDAADALKILQFSVDLIDKF